MKIQNMNAYPNYKKQQNIAFKASPQKIIEIVKDPKITGLCPGKKAFIIAIADFFKSIEEKLLHNTKSPLKQLDISLGSPNEHIPDSIKSIQAEMVMWKGSPSEQRLSMTVEKMDEFLNGDRFKCNPQKTCGCGAGKSKGEYMNEILNTIANSIKQTYLELPNPGIIELFKR